MILNTYSNYRKKIYIAVAVILIAFVSYRCSVYLKKKNANSPRPAVAVNVIKLYPQIVSNVEEMPGRASAYRFAEIRPQVEGIIIRRLFTEGSNITKGQQLYQIDPAPYLASYNSAKADLQKARAIFEAAKAKNARYEKLVKIQAVSQQEYDEVKSSLASANAGVEIAKAELQKAEIYLEYTRVLAPISGRIGKSEVTEGSLVSANQAEILTTITQLNPIYVDIVRSSEDFTRFQNDISGKSQIEIDLYLSNGMLYNHRGTLQFAEVNVDPSTSSVEMRAIFDNPDNTLLPGSFVKARIQTNSKNAILIPQKATFRNPDGTLMVWLVDEKNKVNPKPIKTLKAIGGNWLVESGVKAGDIIVIEGLQKIAPGTLVKPVFEEENNKS
jgi:membrane fusion protein (multidrug efflux system)